ncbi:ribosomal protein S18-alanine N-acetyltransferase [Endozoicomonas sp. SCSIO W0465]|uniref:ribosomal protein S18-alanine N-acetyltransferase n=1 Tax=Endozoicomonas sp. SCSIO W0465 TaxID=2918516 RepID=UPI002074D09C|nr:ribosomal protein S18-alanine N-acetyltransferase [Endozoicomonas sp. SCSIO W0465]USE35154.1 ribosomal protein S18-alanine N-acetyltransferase [Endozoicomonas sp. SCSIO W0465]
MTKPSPTFRPMQETDLEQINAVEQLSAEHPWRTAHFSDSLTSGYTCELAVLGNQVVGHCVMMMAAGEASILILTVDKPFQRRGIGRQLLQHMVKKAAQSDCKTILLEVRRSNIKAFNLYLDEGFSEIGIRKNYYPTSKGWEDAIVMAMELETFLD